MIETVAAIAFATLAGAPIAKALDRDAPLGRWAGLSFLCGIGVCMLVLLAFALIGVRWTLFAVIAVIALISIAFVRRAGIRTERFHAVDILSVVALAAYGRYATAAAAPWELDFIDNWGLKGRVFALHGGIDWQFVQNPWYWWSHPDYPPLLPLTFDFASLFAGRWDAAGVGAICVAFAVAALLIIRSLAGEELSSPFAAGVATFVVLWLIITPWIGLADGPLVAYATCGILYIRRKQFAPGAVLMGLGAECKNEGLAFLAAVAAGMLCDRELRRHVLRIWPAVAIAVPWLIVRSARHLATDLATGPLGQRVAEHVLHPGQYVRLLVEYGLGQKLFWVGVVIAIAVAGWRSIIRERFVVVTVAVQFAAYVAAYIVTPLDVAFHIRWSWDRLVAQLTPVIAVIALLSILPAALVSRPVAVDEQDGNTV